MDCKEFEKKIPDFIEKKMDFLTLREFSAHIDECQNCKEELEIQFLVNEGMQRLEEGNAFDLKRELDQRIAEAKRKMHFHNSFLKVGMILELLAAAGIAAAVLCLLL